MTRIEMGELDNWIFENLNCTGSNQSPTRDPAASMAVLKKCAKFLGTGRVHIYAPYGQFSFWMVSNAEVGRKIAAEASAETLELAIALFARKLFDKK